MAISEVVSPSGVKSFTVYVNLRSKPMPHVRFQKRINGIRTQTEAIRVEKTVVKELSMKIAHTEGHGFTWRMVVDQWASFVESPLFMDRQYNPATITDYVSMMQTWTKDWLDRPASEISRGDGREVLDRVLVQGRSKAFQKRVKNTVNMIFNWGIETKVIRGVTCSPVYGLRIVVKEERRPEILKLDEMRKLLSEARAVNHEWYFVWAVALLTGMRNGELYALRWSDVDLDKGLITVQRSFNKRTGEFKSTKAGYWRTVPVSGELRGLLMDIRGGGGETTFNLCRGYIPNGHHHDGGAEVFILPRLAEWRQGQQAKVLKEFCAKISVPKIKFHTLRACFATQLLSDGVEMSKLMKIGGWRDIKTAQVYLRLAGVDERGATDGLRFLPKKEVRTSDVIGLIN